MTHFSCYEVFDRRRRDQRVGIGKLLRQAQPEHVEVEESWGGQEQEEEDEKEEEEVDEEKDGD